MEEEPSELTDQLKLEISIEIASALIELHSGKFKVSHNDTSPMNILMNIIEGEGGYLELKKLALADFGISAVMKKSASLKTQMNVTGVNGNLDYIAPEVLSQGKYYHIKTDVYSFGRLINHLFFNPKFLIIEKKKDGMVDLDINNKLYYQLKNLINDCVKFEPDDRIEMTQVRSQLEKI